MARMGWLPSRADKTEADQRNEHRVAVWSLLYIGAALAVTAAAATDWLPSDALLVAGIGVAALVGVGMIRTYRLWLSELDDLQRKVEIDALALAAGAALVGGWALDHMESAGFIADAGFSEILFVMTLVYFGGKFIGYWRFR